MALSPMVVRGDAPTPHSSPQDSDGDFDRVDERRTFLTMTRADQIKVIEFVDPNALTCGRLAQLTDTKLKQLCYLISPRLCRKTMEEMGVATMAGFKRTMKASSIDNGLMEHLVVDDLRNLEELAISVGWTDEVGQATFNPAVKRVPRNRRAVSQPTAAASASAPSAPPPSAPSAPPQGAPPERPRHRIRRKRRLEPYG